MKKGIVAAGLLAAVLFMLFFASCACADIIINEVMASNGFYENGEAYDWIEIYNDGKNAVDLSGWYLSDSKKDPLKWSFPKGTKLQGGKYLTVFCTGEEGKGPGKGAEGTGRLRRRQATPADSFPVPSARSVLWHKRYGAGSPQAPRGLRILATPGPSSLPGWPPGRRAARSSCAWRIWTSRAAAPSTCSCS